ncbi:hypothetical protein C2E20_8948 isoform B [Micractinium conductrix]|uniref:Sacsin/Nov domain-containing protein n=1 Tax=Micractinium conductrix TaxID=554055 RepID=A0A2P6UZW6_9CHLO|nr:hypothetical protein C2E20_8948 isoform A [Micractinium conductrix]PSC67388.1 hypothetical protein C2E20_8948 isoform B [Micractinium conductrix]|eukprot:PSC67387.1 hypothetical protein C2E20_8948 isoform A [Micractinium conductrix]
MRGSAARDTHTNGRQTLVTVYPREVVERFLKDLRKSYCQQGKHVSVAALTAGLCAQLGVARFEDLGCGKPKDVATLRVLTELERRVAAHVAAYPATRAVGTLWDLERIICAAEKVEAYADLKLGPLLKNPLTVHIFSPAATLTETPQIACSDVMKAIAACLAATAPPRGGGAYKRMGMDDVLRELCRRFRKEEPLELCVRITSLGYPISLLSTMRCEEKAALEGATREMKAAAEKEQREEVERMRKAHEERQQAAAQQQKEELSAALARAQAEHQLRLQSLAAAPLAGPGFAFANPMLQDFRERAPPSKDGIPPPVGIVTETPGSELPAPSSPETMAVAYPLIEEMLTGLLVKGGAAGTPAGSGLPEDLSHMVCAAMHEGPSMEAGATFFRQDAVAGLVLHSAACAAWGHAHGSPWMPPLVHCSADLEDAIRGRVPGPKQGSWEELRSHFAFLHGQSRAATPATPKGRAAAALQVADLLMTGRRKKDCINAVHHFWETDMPAQCLQELLWRHGVPPDVTLARRLRNLERRLRIAEEIEAKQATGWQLNADQAVTLANKPALQLAVDELEEALAAAREYPGAAATAAQAAAQAEAEAGEQAGAAAPGDNLQAHAGSTAAQPAGERPRRPPLPRQELEAALHAAARGASVRSLAGVEAALLQRFEADRFETLGHGSSLLQALAGDEQLLLAACGSTGGGVAAWPEVAAVHAARAAAAAVAEDAAAAAALAAAPWLVEVGAWCSWDAAFEPVLGSLRQFAAAGGTGAAAQHCLLQLPGGGLCKVPADATPGVPETRPTAERAPEAAAAAAGSASASASSRGDECKALVEAIRQEEFGFGLMIEGEGRQLTERMNERMGRALKRLSHELYSKDAFFVLKLVQNADDNAYPAGVMPALEFILSPRGVLVLNNEPGFAERDVGALCDVGRSTKEHKAGLIGAKGIGFKAVFRVSDAPEVHSAGYHITFDLAQNGALGYILPAWIPAEARAALADPGSQLGLDPAACTAIALPFKETLRGRGGGGGSLRRRFEDLHTSLLLFLQKLHCTVVTGKGARRQVSNVMVKQRLGGGLVELRHGSQAQHAARWLVVSRQLAGITVPRKEDRVESTVVALGFCLEGQVPGQQQVFAFLPLCSYGLRFIVQADFILPSSREAGERVQRRAGAGGRSIRCSSARTATHTRDVEALPVPRPPSPSPDSDSPWNELLRSEVPALFLQSLEEFKALPPPEGGPPELWVDRWYRSIPLEGEAQGFFAPLPASIAAKLRGARCVLAGDGSWVLPHEALTCTNEEVRRLVSPEQLAQFAGLHYVHAGLRAVHASPPLRAALGVAELSGTHLVQLLRGMHSQGQLASADRAWLASLLAALGSLPAAPTGGSKHPGWSSHYFPAAGEGGARGTPAAAALAALDVQALGIQLLDSSFLAAVDARRRPLLTALLQSLGVREISPQGVAEEHILPMLESEAALQLPPTTLVAFTGYCISSGLLPAARGQGGVRSGGAGSGGQLWERLRGAAVVVTREGPVRLRAAPRPLHLPLSLGNKLDLATLFPHHPWLLLSDAYARHKGVSPAAWGALFQRWGATPFLHVRKERRQLSADDLAGSSWGRAVLEALRQHGSAAPEQGQLTVEDWVCPEFDALLGSIEKATTPNSEQHMVQLTRLAAALDSSWEEHFAAAAHAQAWHGPPEQGAGTPELVPSSFAHALRHSAWLSSTLGGAAAPADLFASHRGISALLGSHVAYPAVQLRSSSGRCGGGGWGEGARLRHGLAPPFKIRSY